MDGIKNKEKGIKKKRQAKWNEENEMKKTELMTGTGILNAEQQQQQQQNQQRQQRKQQQQQQQQLGSKKTFHLIIIHIFFYKHLVFSAQTVFSLK